LNVGPSYSGGTRLLDRPRRGRKSPGESRFAKKFPKKIPKKREMGRRLGRATNVSFTPDNGLKRDIASCPFRAKNGLMHRSNSSVAGIFRRLNVFRDPFVSFLPGWARHSLFSKPVEEGDVDLGTDKPSDLTAYSAEGTSLLPVRRSAGPWLSRPPLSSDNARRHKCARSPPPAQNRRSVSNCEPCLAPCRW
jgi:hypothetical protein